MVMNSTEDVLEYLRRKAKEEIREALDRRGDRSAEELAWYVGMSRGVVIRALQELEAEGTVKRDRIRVWRLVE